MDSCYKRYLQAINTHCSGGTREEKLGMGIANVPKVRAEKAYRIDQKERL